MPGGFRHHRLIEAGMGKGALLGFPSPMCTTAAESIVMLPGNRLRRLLPCTAAAFPSFHRQPLGN